MNQSSGELKILQCDSLPQAQKIRAELIMKTTLYWFFVTNKCEILAANEFGGRLDDERLLSVTNLALDLKEKTPC